MERQSDENARWATSRRLVLAADAELQALERELHSGLQQHLVALSVGLQLARSLAKTDPAAASRQLEDVEQDLQHALEAAARLAQRMYAPVYERDGLGAALRAAAVGARAQASVSVAPGVTCSPEVARTVYLLWTDALEARSNTRPAISVVEEAEAILFEIVAAAGSDSELAARRDRVEALGGRLTVEPEPGGRVRVRGTLPRSAT